ncbi:hypothetical protein F290043J8_29030 [Mediterraneibacter gnavus]
MIIGRLVIRNNKFKITKSTILFIKRNNLLSTLNKRSKMFVLSELFFVCSRNCQMLTLWNPG